MLKRAKILFYIIIAAAVYSCGGNKAVQIPISDFFKTPQKSAFKISPDGKYISYLKPFKEKQNLFIKSLTDGKEQMATSFDDYSVNDYFWTYNDQIVFTQDVIASDEYKLYALDVATLKVRNLVSEQKVKIRILNLSKSEPDKVTLGMNKRDPGSIDIYNLDLKTGNLQAYLINPGNLTEWFPDDDGKIRLAKESDGVNETILFRENDAAPFKPIIVNNFKDRVEPIAFTGHQNNFYALSNVNRDKTALVEINAETGKEEKVIFADEHADILNVAHSRNKHCLDYASWEEARPHKYFLNKNVAAIYNIFLTKLKGNEIRIVDRDSVGNKFIINSYTDRNPGSFYLYDRTTQQLTKLGDINSSINPSELCAMKPIQYKAGDGTLINGYLTLPQGNDTTNLPVVVMPHDWPYGPLSRNSWGYNPEVQFLANRRGFPG